MYFSTDEEVTNPQSQINDLIKSHSQKPGILIPRLEMTLSSLIRAACEINQPVHYFFLSVAYSWKKLSALYVCVFKVKCKLKFLVPREKLTLQNNDNEDMKWQ